jgi:uncharacterized SAM-binding protein YcdF (DUF218 family)
LSSALATARHLVAVLLAASAAWGLMIGGLLIWPSTRTLSHADAVVVLAGDHGERLPRARALLRRGVANTLVLDGAPDSDQAMQLCAGGQLFQVICLFPRPDSTATEAQAAARLSAARHWKTLIVVTTTDHVLRARMRFRRCFKGALGLEGAALHASTAVHIKAVVHEWFGTVFATVFDRGC